MVRCPLAGVVLKTCSLRRRFGCSWHPTEIISMSLDEYPRDHLGPIVQDLGGRNLLCSGIIPASQKPSRLCVSAGPHFKPDLTCHTEVSVVTEQPTSGPWKAGQGTDRHIAENLANDSKQKLYLTVSCLARFLLRRR